MKYLKQIIVYILCLSIITGQVYTKCTAAAKTKDLETQEKQIEKILNKMILKEKIAQMILTAMPDNAITIQENYQFGGYILFGEDFNNSTPKSIAKKIKNIQNVSKIPMLIAVDEEGGTVVRASKYKKFREKPYASPCDIYNNKKWNGIIKDTKSKSKFLKNLGINTNLAPVADVAYKKSDFIYKRSFSTDENKVSKYIKTVITTMKKQNIISTLKHFPGYGNNGDTHTQLIHDYRSKKTFKQRDLKPFQSGIDANCDMVMISHNIVHCFDAKNPASISPKVVSYLRNNMDFSGVIMTDSITMNGLVQYTGSIEKAAIKAVRAGNDLLCTTEYQKTYKALIDAVKEDKIPETRIDESVKRILTVKYNHKIIK